MATQVRPQPSSYASASFRSETDACATKETIGPCWIGHGCNPVVGRSYTAGAITFDGTSAGSIALDAGGYAAIDGVAFAAGDTVHVHATGGDVPAFDAMAIAPAQATITSPARNTIPQADVTVTWTGQATGTLAFFADDGIDGDSTLARCYVPAALGSAVLPQIALQGATVVSMQQQTFDAGDWPVTYALEIEALWPE